MSNNPAQTSSMFGHPGQQAGTSNSPAQQAHLPNNPAEQPGQSLPPAQQIIVGAPLTPAQARDLQTIEKQRAHQRTIDRIVGAGRPWWLIPLTQVEISVLLDNKIRLVSQLGGRDILYLHDFTRRVPHQPLYDAMLGVEDRGLDPELLDLIETLRNEAYDHIIGQPSTSAIRTSAADEASAIAPVPDPHPSAPNPINGAATYAPAPHDSVAYDSGPFHPAASGSAARGSAVHVPPATVTTAYGYLGQPNGQPNAAHASGPHGPTAHDPTVYVPVHGPTSHAPSSFGPDAANLCAVRLPAGYDPAPHFLGAYGVAVNGPPSRAPSASLAPAVLAPVARLPSSHDPVNHFLSTYGSAVDGPPTRAPSAHADPALHVADPAVNVPAAHGFTFPHSVPYMPIPLSSTPKLPRSMDTTMFPLPRHSLSTVLLSTTPSLAHMASLP